MFLDCQFSVIKFQIEPVTQQHHPAVVNLIQQNLSEFAIDRDSLSQLWQRWAAQSHVFARVAVAGGAVIGYANVVIEQKIHGDALGHMESLVVDLRHRNLGVGRALMLELLQVAQSQGCYKTVCITQPYNVEFLRGCGFEPCQVGMQVLHAA